MEQLILHLVGDYVTQSDWMANNKVKSDLAAWVHALVYSLPFLLLIGSAPSPACAGMTILCTHFLIDRYRLAKYVVYAKNFLAPKEKRYLLLGHGNTFEGMSRYYPWAWCDKTGYQRGVPDFMAIWLLIAADNTLHLAINYVSLRWL